MTPTTGRIPRHLTACALGVSTVLALSGCAPGEPGPVIVTETVTSTAGSDPAPTTPKHVPKSTPRPTTGNPVPTENPLPADFRAALGSATRFNNHTGYSKQGLLDQLLYQGYSYEAAWYAVDNVAADWYLNARRSAEGYVLYSGYSKVGLHQQLLYEGYLPEEATYGVETVDTDWYENARRSAVSYQRYSDMTVEQIYEQLIIDGYTPDEADHGLGAL